MLHEFAWLDLFPALLTIRNMQLSNLLVVFLLLGVAHALNLAASGTYRAAALRLRMCEPRILTDVQLAPGIWCMSRT